MNNSNNTSTTSSSTEDISAHLNLNNIIGGKAKTLLSTLTCAYFEEKMAGNNPFFPKILLLGPTGKEVFAHATHNSLSNLNFIELEADFLNKGGDDLALILQSCNEHDTIYISNASKMSCYVQNILWKYLKFREVEIVIDIFDRTKETIMVPDVLLILGTTTLQGISNSLHQQFTHCILSPNTSNEIMEILLQRCRYYGISYTAETVFETIAEQAGGYARKAVAILELSRKYMVASGKNEISLLHVQRALTSYCFTGYNKE